MISQEDKLHDIALATTLGPIAPFWGVIDGLCECGGGKHTDDGNKRPGKHARKTGWKKNATKELDELQIYVEELPHSNFAAVMGVDSISVDLDVRENKNGILYLAQFGQLPKTPTIVSGSGGLHLHFRIPTKEPGTFRGLGNFGVDLIQNAGSIIPGSKHENGSYYKWADGLSPRDVGLADLPTWLKDLLRNPVSHSLGAAGEAVEPEGMVEPWTIELRRAGWLQNVRLGSKVKAKGQDRNGIDFHNAKSLARWCWFDWNLYLQIWNEEARHVQLKPTTPKQLASLLHDAFKAARASSGWLPTFTLPKPPTHRKKPLKTPKTVRPVMVEIDPRWTPKQLALMMEVWRIESEADPYILPSGRPESTNTKAVRAAYLEHPDWNDRQIAELVGMGLTREKVKRIRHRRIQQR